MKNIYLHMNKATRSSDYTLHVYKGIVEIQPEVPENAKFTNTADSIGWKNLTLKKLSHIEVSLKEEMKISGADPHAFYEF